MSGFGVADNCTAVVPDAVMNWLIRNYNGLVFSQRIIIIAGLFRIHCQVFYLFNVDNINWFIEAY